MPAKQITVRNIDPELARRLKDLSESRRESVNTTVLHLLSKALDLDARRKRLARYATWSDVEQSEFDDALRSQRLVDDRLWK